MLFWILSVNHIVSMFWYHVESFSSSIFVISFKWSSSDVPSCLIIIYIYINVHIWMIYDIVIHNYTMIYIYISWETVNCLVGGGAEIKWTATPNLRATLRVTMSSQRLGSSTRFKKAAAYQIKKMGRSMSPFCSHINCIYIYNVNPGLINP